MTNYTTKIKIKCRPANAGDTTNVLSLVQKIWDGEDYIPYVWEDWLKDPEGVLAVGETEGHVVGLGKLTRITPENWWLEGLRTHPDYQGHGIANQIFDFLIETWLKTGSGTVRLSTHSENYAVHHMCDKKGFEKVIEFMIYVAPPLPEAPAGTFLKIEPGEENIVIKKLCSSALMRRNANLLDMGWTWAALTIELVEKTIGEELAWWWYAPGKPAISKQPNHPVKPDGLLLLTLDPEIKEGPPYAIIQGLHCPLNLLREFLMDYRRLASQNGYGEVAWNTANHIKNIKALIFSGFAPGWDKSLFIYSRSHNSTINTRL